MLVDIFGRYFERSKDQVAFFYTNFELDIFRMVKDGQPVDEEDEVQPNTSYKEVGDFASQDSAQVEPNKNLLKRIVHNEVHEDEAQV